MDIVQPVMFRSFNGMIRPIIEPTFLFGLLNAFKKQNKKSLISALRVSCTRKEDESKTAFSRCKVHSGELFSDSLKLKEWLVIKRGLSEFRDFSYHTLLKPFVILNLNFEEKNEHI